MMNRAVLSFGCVIPAICVLLLVMASGLAAVMLGQARAETYQGYVIILHDVQHMNGGQNVYITETGKVVLQRVVMQSDKDQSSLNEERYVFRLGDEDLRILINLVDRHSFFEIQIPDRFGEPDEARPEITIRMPTGKTRKIAKWADDTHRDFDAIYHGLLRISQMNMQGEPIYRGKYDRSWLPLEFQ